MPRGTVRRALRKLATGLLVTALVTTGCGQGTITDSQPPAGSPTAPSGTATPTPAATKVALRSTPTIAPTSTPIPTATPVPPTPEVDHALVEALSAALDPLVAATPGELGIVVALPDGRPLYQHGADQLFEAASLYKLGIMVELYRQREAGHRSFDDWITLEPGFFFEGDDVWSYRAHVGSSVRIGDALHAMITLSSNVAAHALLYVAGSGNVNATLKQLGLGQTEIRWSASPYLRPPDSPWPTAEPEPTPELPIAEDPNADGDGDMADGDAPPLPEPDNPDEIEDVDGEVTALGHPTSGPLHAERSAPYVRPATLGPGPYERPPARLANPATANNVTTPADMARLFSLLLEGKVVSPAASQEMLALLADQRITDRLPAALPAGTSVAHKTGNLPGVVHDAGVIYTPGGPLIVVVMSQRAWNETAVIHLARQTALLTYQLHS